MTLRRTAAVLATVMTMGTVLVATSDGPAASDDHATRQARKNYDANKTNQRLFL